MSSEKYSHLIDVVYPILKNQILGQDFALKSKTGNDAADYVNLDLQV